MLRKEFHQWYSNEVGAQGDQYKPVQMPLSVMKPLGTTWLKNAFDHIQSHPDLVKNAFKAAGISSAISELS